MLAVAASALHAQPPKPSEYQVKAAYLYNFGKFVRWPGTSLDQFSICILGHDPFGPALDAAIGGVTIDGQRAIARRLGSPRDALSCRVVFISTSEDVQLGQILEALNKAPVLTVSDIPQFTSRGGMIQFIADANRVRFEVNLTTAETAGLMLSSELLKVAVAVRRIPRSGA